jgi:hypothetical protein
MYHHELPTPEHPAKRSRPQDIARLNVLKTEWDSLELILARHGPCEIIDSKPMPVVAGRMIEVLCRDADTALAVMVAWTDYLYTSPYRKRP